MGRQKPSKSLGWPQNYLAHAKFSAVKLIMIIFGPMPANRKNKVE